MSSMILPAEGRVQGHAQDEKRTTDQTTHAPAIETGASATYDAVFGEITADGPNYRDVSWMGAAALMVKTQIGLGVLSIPVVFNTLGMVPGVLCLLAIAGVTTWSGYIVGCFKLSHPEVYGVDNVAALLFGRVGYGIAGIVFCLYWIFVAGSGILTISIALNALTTHGTCTAVFVACAAIVAFIFSSIPTLSRITWIAMVGVTGILASVFTLTIAVGVQDRPPTAPQTSPYHLDYKVTASPTPAEAFSALSLIILAYAGVPAFFSIVSEMRDPRKYARSLMICQGGITIVYLVVGIIVYYYVGSYVTTPALGSAGPLLKKICYGLALPGLLATTMIVTHLPAKFIFLRILGKSRHLNSNTVVHWTTWLSCTSSVTIIAYIIASSIPIFSSLVSLIGAFFGTLLCFEPMGLMWLYDNWYADESARTVRWKIGVIWSVCVIVVGLFLMVAGTYGSALSIINALRTGGHTSPWTCADNSNSV